MRQPIIRSGVGAISPDGKLAFNVHEPNLKAFYETFINEFINSYNVSKDMLSLLYVVKESQVMIISGLAVGVLAALSSEQLQSAKEKFDELVAKNQTITEITSAISAFLKIPLKSWVGSFDEYKKHILTASIALTAAYSFYKINSIVDARRRAAAFLSVFNGFSHDFVTTVVAKNLAEYFTFRFEEVLMKLADKRSIDRFAIHLIKCMNFNLMSTVVRNNSPVALKNILIAACMSNPPRKDWFVWSVPQDTHLWSKGRCYGACNCSFFRESRGADLKSKESIPYDQVKFASPVRYFNQRDDGAMVEIVYNDTAKRQLGLEVKQDIPAQKVISEEELAAIGFSPSVNNLPKAKL